MADNDLLASLRSTREGYDESVRRDQFHLDAYTGLGGFLSRVAPGSDFPQWPRSWSSATTRQTSAAYTPPTTAEGSYLVQHDREPDRKYRSRIRLAHYPGYVRTVTDLKLSFLLRKPFDRKADDAWTDWYEDTDGAETTWDEILPLVVLRAAILGWCPCLVDAPQGPTGGSISIAQAREAGIEPRLLPLFPANLRDWQTGADGTLEWVKIRTDHLERTSWRAHPSVVETYTVWTREEWSRYVVRQVEGQESAQVVAENEPHSWGRVPLAILRHTPAPDDPVRGLPMHSDVAVEAWRLFNLLSERDEHLRGQVFAVLTMAQDFRASGTQDPTKPPDGTPQSLGASNALEYHYEWPRPEFIAPPATVAATLGDVIASTVAELYRLARVEFARGVASATSGVARAYEFAQTNRALSDFALQIARWHEDVLDLTGITLGASDDARGAAKVTPPHSFDVEDLAGQLEQATAALALSLGVTAEREIKGRLISSLLPNLEDDTKKAIDADLDAEAEERMLREEAALEAARNPPPPPPAQPPPGPFGARRPTLPGAQQQGAQQGQPPPPPNGQPAAQSA